MTPSNILKEGEGDRKGVSRKKGKFGGVKNILKYQTHKLN